MANNRWFTPTGGWLSALGCRFLFGEPTGTNQIYGGNSTNNTPGSQAHKSDWFVAKLFISNIFRSMLSGPAALRWQSLGENRLSNHISESWTNIWKTALGSFNHMNFGTNCVPYPNRIYPKDIARMFFCCSVLVMLQVVKPGRALKGVNVRVQWPTGRCPQGNKTTSFKEWSMMGTFRLPPIFMSTCKLERYVIDGHWSSFPPGRNN